MKPLDLLGDFIAEILPQREANCQLCSLTYSLVFRKKAWGEYLKQLPIKHTFYFKNQFTRDYPNSSVKNFPCVVYANEEIMDVIISSEEMKSINELDQLIDKINQFIKS